jgi:hypothetical protein
MTKPLVLLASGGLGNQLFQWFAIEAISSDLHCEFKVDTGWYKNPSNMGLSTIERNFIAHHFRYVNARSTFVESIYGRKTIYESRLVRYSRGLLSPILGLWFEPNAWPLKILKFSRTLRLFGHWISFSPKFSSVGIRKLVLGGSSCEDQSSEFVELKKELETGGIIALHVRGTDYLKFSNVYGELKSDYYIKAVMLLKKENEQLQMRSQVWVFTDDVDRAKKLLDKSIEVDRFIGPRNELCDCLQMILMSMANGLVCANSTFSWWAARMNRNSNSIIFPKDYMLGQSSYELGLIQKGWISI